MTTWVILWLSCLYNFLFQSFEGLMSVNYRDVIAVTIFDVTFFILVTTIGLNIIFGIIVDTFSELRDSKVNYTSTSFQCIINATPFCKWLKSLVWVFKEKHNNYLYQTHEIFKSEVGKLTSYQNVVWIWCQKVTTCQYCRFYILHSFTVGDRQRHVKQLFHLQQRQLWVWETWKGNYMYTSPDKFQYSNLT